MVLRLSAYLKSAGKGNVFHFLHFNAIFNLFVLSRQRHRQGQGQRLQSSRAPAPSPTPALYRRTTHVFLIDWHFLVGSIRLAKSSEFLEAAKTKDEAHNSTAPELQTWLFFPPLHRRRGGHIPCIDFTQVRPGHL